MAKKARPNDPCPCGSGRKFKKCCAAPGGPASGPLVVHTPAERASAFAKLDAYIDEVWEEEEEEAFELFWGRHIEREDELSPDLLRLSRDVQEIWFSFDHRLESGARIADLALRELDLTPGERSFLLAMRQTTMRLYQVVESVPGISITLRDLVEGPTITVRERTASRTIERHQCLAARILPRGCSGNPEIEAGMLHIPEPFRDDVLAQLKRQRQEYLREHPPAFLDEFYRELPPFFHDVWITSIFEPAVPRLANTDGEEMVLTELSFHVDDAGALTRALDGASSAGIQRREPTVWEWCGSSAPRAAGSESRVAPSADPRPIVSFGFLKLHGDILKIEVNSVERGQRARQLLEQLAGTSIRHRATTHQDVRRMVMESVTARALGKEEEEPASPAPADIDPDVAEAVVLDHLARHYRAWVDEPVPALDGRTPRDAAKLPEMRSRVEDLIQGLERMYEQALKEGQPAYDPSWMWAELGLAEEADASHPPLLAHERVAERVPGSAAASRAAAERFRARPSFSDTSTTLGEDELRGDLDLQRFLRRERPAANDAGTEGGAAAPYMPLMVNLDLHRRKVFWVDEALSYMLENTDVDVAGDELRAPFPSFAVVLTDRHALSLGERLLARAPGDPLRGQILRVITVYVTELHRGDGRALAITFALDALGADLPSLIRHEVPAGDGASVRAFLESVGPRVIAQPELRDTNPLRALLRLTINAILYATSAGVEHELRPAPGAGPKKQFVSSARPRSSDSVFFLPGKIEIRRVRQLQALERAPGGRILFSRFMVRGHWRRPQKGWTDQRLRWIEPYWKGPDMAAVIEKAYRMKE